MPASCRYQELTAILLNLFVYVPERAFAITSMQTMHRISPFLVLLFIIFLFQERKTLVLKQI